MLRNTPKKWIPGNPTKGPTKVPRLSSMSKSKPRLQSTSNAPLAAAGSSTSGRPAGDSRFQGFKPLTKLIDRGSSNTKYDEKHETYDETSNNQTLLNKNRIEEYKLDLLEENYGLMCLWNQSTNGDLTFKQRDLSTCVEIWNIFGFGSCHELKGGDEHPWIQMLRCEPRNPK